MYFAMIDKDIIILCANPTLGVCVPIDPKLMIDFAAIAEEGSFTRAARRLCVAQPWLSARIHKLEKIVGYRLFDRTTRNVSLTELGAELFEAARNVAKSAEVAERLALQLGRRNRSVLRIGAPPYSKTIRERRELIGEFALAHPNVSLEIEMGWSLALLGRLATGNIDLAFIMGDTEGPTFESVVLKRFGVALSLHRDHPWAKAPSISPDATIRQSIQVFVRNLNPGLWDQLYAPLIEAGADLTEVPELAEGAPDRMRSPETVAAYFDFGADDSGFTESVRIPLAAPAMVPFQLLRNIAEPSKAGEEFWQFARSRGGQG